MQNNEVHVEPTSELPSYREVLQYALDEVEQVARDHKVQLERMQDALDEAEQASMHCMMMEETSFSESETSQNLSGDLSSDDEYCGPMDLPCERCSHFLFTEFDRARDHKAQLERILAEPEKQGL